MRWIAGMAVLVLPVASAQAARVEVRQTPQFNGHSGHSTSSSLTFAAAAGEANVVILQHEGDRWRIRDEGAPLTAGSGCAAVTANEAVCDIAGHPHTTVHASLGDGDDRASVIADRGISIDGGAGADSLVGGSGPDSLLGGGGNDALAGGAGDDQFRDESIGLMPPDDDVVDGGPGIDTVDYGHRRRPVRIDLPAGRSGAAGEADALSAIENAVAGPADDVLVGTAGANHLVGASGDDVLHGRGGDDVLDGEFGRDALEGGHGMDVITGGHGTDAVRGGAGADRVLAASDRAHDRVDCGGSRDTVQSLGGTGAPYVRRCETFLSAGLEPDRVTLGERRIRVAAGRCRENACRVRLRITTGSGRVLVGWSRRLRRRQTATATFPNDLPRRRLTIEGSRRPAGSAYVVLAHVDR